MSVVGYRGVGAGADVRVDAHDLAPRLFGDGLALPRRERRRYCKATADESERWVPSDMKERLQSP